MEIIRTLNYKSYPMPASRGSSSGAVINELQHKNSKPHRNWEKLENPSLSSVATPKSSALGNSHIGLILLMPRSSPSIQLALNSTTISGSTLTARLRRRSSFSASSAPKASCPTGSAQTALGRAFCE